jgi:hypothetical protein
MHYDFKTRRDRMERFRSFRHRAGGHRHTIILLAATFIAYALLTA